jgi:hypothetical protein
MAKGKWLTEAEKKNIQNGVNRGTNSTVIGGVIDRDPATIRTFKRRNRLYGDLPPPIKINRSPITAAMGLVIKRTVISNPRISAVKIRQTLMELIPNQNWYPQKTAILQFLKKNNLSKLTPWIKCPINERNRQKRLDFANFWLVDGQDTLGNVMWTDETRIQSNPIHRRVKVWARTGTQQKNLPVQTKLHSGGIGLMFWGCISKHGRGPLLAIDGTLNGIKYIEVLRNELLPEIEYARETFGANFKLMQDNAPAHRAKVVKDFLAANDIEFLEWPPYSPDLNPIENVWQWVKHKLETEYAICRTEDELFDRTTSIWEQLTPELCSAFCSDYAKRLEAVIAANGMHTKY